MRLPGGVFGFVALAVLTLYSVLVAMDVEGWDRPYLMLFSLIGKWGAVGVLALLTLFALVFALKNNEKREEPPKPIQELPLELPVAAPRVASPGAPIVSAERIARALSPKQGIAARVSEELKADYDTGLAAPEDMSANAGMMVPGANAKAGPAAFGTKRAGATKPAKPPPQKMLQWRNGERISVRLVPQVPIVESETAAGWLAGGARLPPGMAWPAIDGEALQLLAQIDCTQLPAGLWGGLGPRQGWLAIFLGPRSFKPHVLHFQEAGGLQPAPAMPFGAFILGPGLIPAFPRWPVEVVTVQAGQEEPRHSGQSYGMQHLLGQSWDVSEPRFLPFDWPSAQRMMQLAVDAAGKAPDPEPEQMEDFEARSTEAMTGPSLEADMLKKLTNLKAAVDTMAASVPFSGAVMDLILAEMRGIAWHHQARPLNGEGGGQSAGLPFTSHDPAAPGWQRDYVLYLQERAKHVYAEQPNSLHADFLADCEEFWKELAAFEMAGMGHVPWAKPGDFDEDQDLTLLELPSSELMNWRFGDGKNLVITMKTSHLSTGRFETVNVQII